MMRALLLGAVVLTAGCADEPPMFESGARLRARILAGEDGSRFLRGWVDTELDFDCDIAEVDGRLRCLPPDALALDLYADAACTVPAALAGTAPEYVYERLGGSRCEDSPRRYYRPAEGEGQLYYLGSDGCRTLLLSPGPYVVAGEPVDVSGFVELVDELVPGHDGLDARVRRSADGARWVAGAVDRASGVAMVPELSVHPALWRPERVAYARSLFDDDACTRQVAEAPDRCAPPAAVLRIEPGSGCARGQLHELGEARTATEPVFMLVNDDACSLSRQQPTLSFEVGAALPATEVSLAAVGSDRLRVYAASIGDGYALPLGPIIDIRFGVRCEDRIAADGSERCVPMDAWAAYYSDPDCRQRLAEVGGVDDCTSSGRGLALEPPGRDGRHHVFRVSGGAELRTEVYSMDTGRCERITAPGTLFARVLGEVPASEFVAVEERVE